VLNGEACLDLFRGGLRPDIILMDINLGKGHMDGLETTRLLHREWDTPVILHTAYADAQTLQRSQEMTKYGYIHKVPGNGAIIVAGIQLALKLYQTERELMRREKRYRELSNHIQQLREQQEQRIAQDIHDDLGQSLTALKMNLTMLDQETLPIGAREILDEMGIILDGTIRKVRSIIELLRPPLLDSDSICEALEWYCRQFSSSFRVKTLWTCDPSLDAVQSDRDCILALFRIAQESMTNGVKHGKASVLEVNLSVHQVPRGFNPDLGFDGKALCLEVKDDGIGFSPEVLGWQPKNPGPLYTILPRPSKYAPLANGNPRPGGGSQTGRHGRGPTGENHSFGIIGMEERALQNHGWFTLDSRPRGGTRVVAGIPLKQERNR
jgi:signal transduction histidine kinase